MSVKKSMVLVAFLALAMSAHAFAFPKPPGPPPGPLKEVANQLKQVAGDLLGKAGGTTCVRMLLKCGPRSLPAAKQFKSTLKLCKHVLKCASKALATQAKAAAACMQKNGAPKAACLSEAATKMAASRAACQSKTNGKQCTALGQTLIKKVEHMTTCAGKMASRCTEELRTRLPK